MAHKKWSTEEIKLIVLEILRGEKTSSQICKEYGVSEASIYKWKNKALQSLDEVFTNKGQTGKAQLKAEKNKLLRIIGEQACVIDTLKKIAQTS